MRRLLRGTALALSLAALSGCAVMRIDVDVYKGPLADHRDVQVQGFAVMAQGAKPLLIQLRDLLQWPDEYDRQCARRSPWYEAGAFEMRQEPLFDDPDTRARQNQAVDAPAQDLPVYCPPGVTANIWNEKAERVNAVLSLYEDRIPSPYSVIAEELGQELNRFRNAVAYLEGKNALGERRNEKLWAEISKGFYPTEPGGLVPALQEPILDATLGFKIDRSLLRHLQLSYKAFLELPLTPSELAELPQEIQNERYASDKVRLAYRAIIDAVKSVPKAQSIVELIEGGALETKDSDSANQIFRFLQDKSVRDTHLLLLFRDPNSTAAQDFSREVELVARSFLNAREALREIWILSLDAILILNGTEDFLRMGIVGPKATKLTKEQRQNLRELNEKERARYIKDFAEIATDLVQPRYLMAALLSRNNAPNDVRQMGLEIRRNVNQLNLMNSTAALLAGISYLEQSLKVWLQQDPVATIRWLRAADRWIQDVSQSDFDPAPLVCGSSSDPCFYMESEIHRKFGIVQGPGKESVGTLLEVIEDASQVIALSAVGLDRGRLDEGLETLLENYLEAHSLRSPLDVNEVSSQHDNHALARLTDAMLGFSRKVLIIADNDKLLSDDSGNRSSAASAGARNRPEDTGQRQPIGRRAQQFVNRKELDRYILVLQAVGNSIRIQADELRQWERYNERLEDREAGELVGLTEAFSLTDDEIVEIYLDKLRDRQAKSEVSLALVVKQDAAAQGYLALVNSARNDEPLDSGMTPASGDAVANRKVLDLVQLRDAHRVLNEGAQSAHRKAIDDAVKTAASNSPNTKITGEAARDVIATYLEAAANGFPASLQTSPEALLLKNAKLYFSGQGTGTFAVVGEDAGSAVVAAIAARLSSLHSLAKAELTALQTEALKKASAVSVELVAKKREAKEFEAAIVKLSALRQRILAAAPAATPRARPGRIKQVMLDLLDREIEEQEADCEAAEKPALCTTRGLLAGLAEPEIAAQAIAARPRDEKEGAKDVLDDLIAMLRYDLVRAIREDGQNSVQARQAGEALKAAYDQRAGLAYIRPAGAYLRSSYPSTSLQDDPGLTWTNMLVDHGLRTTPFVGKFYRDFETDRQKAEITAEIDKQFWQTVNSVRVAGAGQTNYVIAKDPVGNWYVKSYSANPRDIIRSAQSLALFGMSTSQSGDLLARIRQREAESGDSGGPDGTPPSPSAAPAGPLENLLASHQQRYEDATVGDFNDLRELVDDPGDSRLTQDLNTTLGNNPDTRMENRRERFTGAVNTAASRTLGAAHDRLEAVESNAAAQARAQAILAALTELQEFLPVFQQQVRGLNIVGAASAELTTAKQTTVARESALATLKASLPTTPDETQTKQLEKAEADLKAAQEAEKTKQQNLESAQRAESFAISEARRILHKHLNGYIERRRKAIDEYEAAVVFIGDANNPEPPPTPAPAPPATPTQ